MATLRDFAILAGKKQKRIAHYFLPVEAFVYIAFFLQQQVASGAKIIDHSDWKLFLLSPRAVEHLFLEAHQRNFLNYQAAGAVIRIEFPYQNRGELVHAIGTATPGAA